MTDLTKNFDQLGVDDLARACFEKNIDTNEDDDREVLLKKLTAKKSTKTEA